MADAPLIVQLQALHATIASQNAQTSIPKFSGDPKQFRNWTKTIQKQAKLASAYNDENLKHLAYLTSENQV